LATSKRRASKQPREQRRLLTTAELAELLNTTTNAIYSMRYRGDGPKWIRTTQTSVRYRPEDVEAWLEERAAATASQAPPAA
jgi:predicted DNA-binding transcriptional regulator AlpA